jgi:hypothetical protein
MIAGRRLSAKSQTKAIEQVSGLVAQEADFGTLVEYKGREK